ncbi:hypothetical protein [Actinopolyspora mortivallis]|nr:hypothetical protein [Actinopolyspora mortivallis]
MIGYYYGAAGDEIGCLVLTHPDNATAAPKIAVDESRWGSA